MKKNDRHVQFEKILASGLITKLSLDDIAWLLINFNKCLELISDMSTHWNTELDRCPNDYIHKQWIKKAKQIIRDYNYSFDGSGF